MTIRDIAIRTGYTFVTVFGIIHNEPGKFFYDENLCKKDTTHD